jgi:hypothetical protein
MCACRTAPAQQIQGWRWDKTGANEETFARDRSFCLHGATGPRDAFARHFGEMELDPDRFAACMTIRGYTRSDSGRFGLAPETAPGAPVR